MTQHLGLLSNFDHPTFPTLRTVTCMICAAFALQACKCLAFPPYSSRLVERRIKPKVDIFAHLQQGGV